MRLQYGVRCIGSLVNAQARTGWAFSCGTDEGQYILQISSSLSKTYPTQPQCVFLLTVYSLGTIPSLPRQLAQRWLFSSSNGKENQQIQTRNPLQHIFDKRPNWRRDYDLSKWLPRWLPGETVKCGNPSGTATPI